MHACTPRRDIAMQQCVRHGTLQLQQMQQRQRCSVSVSTTVKCLYGATTIQPTHPPYRDRSQSRIVSVPFARVVLAVWLVCIIRSLSTTTIVECSFARFSDRLASQANRRNGYAAVIPYDVALLRALRCLINNIYCAICAHIKSIRMVGMVCREIRIVSAADNDDEERCLRARE